MNKSSILESLKKQVLQLKTQLNNLENRKQVSPLRSKNMSRYRNVSPRFDTNNFDSSLINDAGVKRFRNKYDNSRNISQLIHNKSCSQKVPYLSPYRKAQIIQTNLNFNSKFQSLEPKPLTQRNPITGVGYKPDRRGVKIVQKYPHVHMRSQGKRHFY